MSTTGSADLPRRASQARQAQQLVAAHRDTGDALRIRPSLLGWLGASELLLAQRELRAALEFVDSFLHVLLF